LENGLLGICIYLITNIHVGYITEKRLYLCSYFIL